MATSSVRVLVLVDRERIGVGSRASTPSQIASRHADHVS